MSPHYLWMMKEQKSPRRLRGPGRLWSSIIPGDGKAMLLQDIIRKKRDNGALSESEIGHFVTALTDGSAPSEQVAALAMAIYFQGMTFAETGALVRAMTASGQVINWAPSRLNGPTCDKHSTGGIGDKVSLMLAPIAAACGLYVPMISGRGLGHTGGTLDKLEAIPGYQTRPGLDRFRDIVAEVGCAIVGQSGELAPADGRLYAIRDVTATVESIPLITASILSKKLAAGLDSLVMDIKTGSGAFMREPEQARALAREMIGAAAQNGLTLHALITDMDQPLGETAGNAVEVAETLAYLTCARREPRLDDLVLTLAARMLIASGLETDEAAARTRAETALTSGAAAERFGRMVHALGGPADFLEKAGRHLAAAPVVRPVFLDAAGHVDRIDTRAVGMAIVAMGGGRQRVEDAVDPAVGFSGFVAVGGWVSPDQPVAFVHAANEAQAEQASAALKKAYSVAESPPPACPVVHDLITGA